LFVDELYLSVVVQGNWNRRKRT